MFYLCYTFQDISSEMDLKRQAMNNLTITEEMLSDLPEPVKRYIRYSGVVGSSWIESVRLTQVGKFRQSAEQPWMRFSAEQSYTTKPAGYRWNATFKMAGIPLLKAEDKYEEGHGRMYGKLAGLKTIFDEEGEQIDQASMLRYLNEMMWFPTAFLQDNVSWEELDDKNAKVKFSDAGREGEAQMHFDPEGRLRNFTAMRYRENSGEYSLDRWSTPITAYGE
jgi:hypothetical protein